MENAESSKYLYKICDELLNREQKAILPSHDCAQSLANKFVEYFNDKIELTRNNIETSLNSSTDQVPNSVSIFRGVSFEQFNVVSEANIRKIICSSPVKSYTFDPIPKWLLNQCQNQLVPVLTTIVNASLFCAEFPTWLLKAFLTPLSKKIIHHCEVSKNYRHMCNLSFISKLVERTACVQLLEHLKTNNLHEIFQSAYRQLHSTETPLLRVHNNEDNMVHGADMGHTWVLSAPDGPHVGPTNIAIRGPPPSSG